MLDSTTEEYRSLLDSLPPSHLRAATTLATVLHEAGHQCYLVGGVVRDLAMGRKTGDLDAATDARPERVASLFNRVIPTGIKHGTVTVILYGCPIEVTTYRSESVYTDARRPDSVDFATDIEEDLQRRDFTINALAYDPLKKEIIDLHEGLRDIKSKKIRTIGNPLDRFHEDGLRTVRACRLAAVLEFDIEQSTRMALSEKEILKRTSRVAHERFSDELWKGFAANHVSRMIRPLEDSGIAAQFIPAFRQCRTDEIHLIMLDSLEGSAPELKMALWWMRAGILDRNTIEDTARDLRFSIKKTKFVVWYEKFAAFEAELARSVPIHREDLKHKIRIFLSDVKKSVGKYTEEFLRGIGHIPEFTIPPELLLEIYSSNPLVVTELEIGGKEMQSMGIHGKRIGEVLDHLLIAVLKDPSLNKQETLLEIARQYRNTV